MNRWRPNYCTARRRALRQAQTDAERVPWYHLGFSQLGAKFRPQHSVGPYVLDFYCSSIRLAVEVDGDGHADALRREHDDERTAFLEMEGIRVFRVSNHDVLTSIDSVLEGIRGPLTLPSPAAAGEGS